MHIPSLRGAKGLPWLLGCVGLVCASGSLGTGCTLPMEPDDRGLTIASCVNNDSDPDSDVAFADVLALLNRTRPEGGCTCHNPNDADASGFRTTGLSLVSYDSIMAGGSSPVVVPGNPCDSPLYRKTTTSPPFGERMPKSGPPFLSDEQQMLLHDWIAEGAHGN